MKIVRIYMRRTGTPGPATRNGKRLASNAPGQGMEPDFGNPGKPVAVYGDAP